ncbi:MAG: hypothetical protein U0P45_12340 [Acidimicrobiales bacterium]
MAEPVDQAELFGDRHEVRWPDDPVGGVGPSGQGFEADQVTLPQVVLGLEHCEQLALEQRRVELSGGDLASAQAFVELRIDHLDRAPGPLLGEVHGAIGLAHHGVGVVLAGGDGHADAGRQGDRAVLDEDRRLEHLLQPSSEVERLDWPAQVLAAQGELVAADPGQDRARRERVPEPFGDHDQDQVGCFVPEALVDRPEAVEPEVQHREVGPAAGGASQRPCQVLVEQARRSEAGEGVEQRLESQVPLEAASIGDVEPCGDEAGEPDDRVFDPIDGGPDRDRVAIAASDGVLALPVAHGGDGVDHLCPQVVLDRREPDVLGRAAERFLRRQVQRLGGPIVPPHQDPAVVGHAHRHRDPPQEALLEPAGDDLRPFGGGVPALHLDGFDVWVVEAVGEGEVEVAPPPLAVLEAHHDALAGRRPFVDPGVGGHDARGLHSVESGGEGFTDRRWRDPVEELRAGSAHGLDHPRSVDAGVEQVLGGPSGIGRWAGIVGGSGRRSGRLGGHRVPSFRRRPTTPVGPKRATRRPWSGWWGGSGGAGCDEQTTLRRWFDGAGGSGHRCRQTGVALTRPRREVAHPLDLVRVRPLSRRHGRTLDPCTSCRQGNERAPSLCLVKRPSKVRARGGCAARWIHRGQWWSALRRSLGPSKAARATWG